MSETSQPAAPEFGLLRLRTLVRLRWLAIIGQSAAVLIVEFALGYRLPLSACLALIAVSAWLNVFLTLRWRGSLRLSTQAAGILLGYDVMQLAGLLYLTGGLQNPFALLFLVPVTVSATSLPLAWTAALGALGLLCSSVLAFFHRPLPWADANIFALPPLYLLGVWAAIVCATIFSAIYARRIAEEARLMYSALQATELVLAREQRLSALDGLAAAAAHELGTPLATIALVAKELKRALPAKFEHAEDIDLLVSQAARCREILTRLAVPEQLSDETYQQVGFEAMLEDMVAPLRGSDVGIEVDAKPIDERSTTPVFRRNPAISYGLGNILENAIDFAKGRVDVKARWSATQVSLSVTDDGPGFDQAIFDRLGDPFVTTRPGYGDAFKGESEEHEGMGLGLFIAKTLLERTGAAVTLSNRKAPDSGAMIQIVWPRVVVDVGKSA
ncbi:ActS/PrrB/RegB family redox-sensitive histidine kinase [Aestuariivirga litoralis]|uniref:ActS/PrrB/RegB family redox-sensitive histidine kinase n=1 Tax=Aestuariivirga litoralis TaxID=2650924 RepID=UPI0018C65BDC|nr:ActS/PrrB/RegB family redox-sensitive histidine kinase [Aestuariivirga litoralis]MBG1233791.1 ActS/PrrB/RegB family redox-sensitive histidine kinase [Aestuariivirga litoralis]